MTITLTPLFIGITVGSLILILVLLGLAIYFFVARSKRKKERDSYLDEKDDARSPRAIPTRNSSVPRTGNGMTLKFDPPKLSDAQPPPRSALRQPKDFQDFPSSKPSKTTAFKADAVEVYESPATPPFPKKLSKSPLTLSFISKEASPAAQIDTEWPFQVNVVEDLAPIIGPAPTPKPITPIIEEKVETAIPAHFSFAFNEPLRPVDEKQQIAEEIYTAAPATLSREDLKSGDFIVDPFKDPAEEPVSKILIEDEERTKPSMEYYEDYEKTFAPEFSVLDPFTDQDSISVYLDDLDEEYLDRESIDEEIPQPVEIPPPEPVVVETEQTLSPMPVVDSDPEIQAPIEEKIEEPAIVPTKLLVEEQPEEIIPQRNLAEQELEPEVLSPIVVAENLRYSTISEIDSLLEELTNGSESERTETPEPLTPALTREPLLPRKGADNSAFIEERDRTRSPLRRNPVIAAEINTFSLPPVPPIPEEQPSPPMNMREASPLRRNPQTRHVSSLLAEHRAETQSDEPGADMESKEEEEQDECAHRGRSMVRTSDIIQARLSRIAPKEQGEAVEQEAMKVEPVPKNTPVVEYPAISGIVAAVQTDRMLSPLRRNPSQPPNLSTVLKRRSQSLSSKPSSPPTSPSSSLLRSTPEATKATTALSTPSALLRPVQQDRGNNQFSDALSKFQTMAAQNPFEGVMANNEVTQRAIAGIYIPTSLREQAVKNYSTKRAGSASPQSRSSSQPPVSGRMPSPNRNGNFRWN
jgi:hypothetical protein